MKRAQFHEEASDDLKEAMGWYERQKEGLGAEFRSAFEDVLSRIVATPLRFAPIHGEVRCARLKRFPYGVLFYPIRDDAVVVLAVMHHSRDPERWKQRL